MQYAVRRRLGFTAFVMPPLTPTLGPWIAPLEGREGSVLAREKDIVAHLHAQLPQHDYFAQNFAVEITNWLPWHWLGYQQTTRYTYVLDLTRGEDALWNGCLPKVRSDVRKATSRFGVSIRSDVDLGAFLAVQELTFKRQGLRSPIERRVIERVDAACAARGCRKVFVAVDPTGATHAAVYLVWDSWCAYYLMGGGDPVLRNSGATSLALWEAIRFAATVAPVFDFEGSMMESVERFIRGFGAIPRSYHRVWRAPNRIVGAALGLRAAMRALAGPRRP
jgi:lipid II:glycine glycyltransferase (peptidoglycan interpeptide bridge formation enzyme)